MNYIDKLIEDRKNFLENKLKGKKETIRIYTEEIARCNKSIKDIEKELEEINKIVGDNNEKNFTWWYRTSLFFITMCFRLWVCRL